MGRRNTPGCRCCATTCTGTVAGNVTYSGCGTTNNLSGATVTVTKTSGGATVGTTTTNGSGNYSLALTSPTDTSANAYTITVTAAGFTTQTATVTVPCNGTATHNFTTPATAYKLLFGIKSGCSSDPTTCAAPSISITATDAHGTNLGSVTTGSDGTAVLSVPTSAPFPITYTTSSADYGAGSGSTTGGFFSVDPVRGCVWNMPALTLSTLTGHYCFGGAQPPGATGALPGTVFVTLPTSGTYGSLSGSTVTCTLDAGSGGTAASWTSACLPVTGLGVFTQRAKVQAVLKMGACNTFTAGTVTGSWNFRTFTTTDCSGTSSTPVGDQTTGQPIYNPVSFTTASGGSVSE